MRQVGESIEDASSYFSRAALFFFFSFLACFLFASAASLALSFCRTDFFAFLLGGRVSAWIQGEPRNRCTDGGNGTYLPMINGIVCRDEMLMRECVGRIMMEKMEMSYIMEPKMGGTQ